MKIHDLIGENCITLDDGEIVFRLIVSELNNNSSIELDFTGVRVYASPFFNGAVGKLLAEYSPEELNNRLTFHGLSEHGDQVLRRVTQNARRYYSDKKFRDAVDKVAAEHSEGF
jgi:hypothetical protein